MGNERGGAEVDHWSIYERLPDSIRRLFMYDGHNWKCGWAEGLVACHGETRAFDLIRQQFAVQRRVTILKYYGPAHPQVRP